MTVPKCFSEVKELTLCLTLKKENRGTNQAQMDFSRKFYNIKQRIYKNQEL